MTAYNKGDIISFEGAFFEVESNHGDYGTVWVLDEFYGRTGVTVDNFQWVVFGKSCELIPFANQI